MIVDIGGGTTEVAVISLGGVVANKSVRVGGDDLTTLLSSTSKEYSVALGIRTSEELKIKLASAWVTEELYAEVRGRDLITGLKNDRYQALRSVKQSLSRYQL